MFNNSCPVRVTHLVISSSAAGSSASTVRTSPTFIFSIAIFVRKTGSGQNKPVASNLEEFSLIFIHLIFDHRSVILIPIRVYLTLLFLK